MQTITLDTNQVHGLALVVDQEQDSLENARYEPLTAEHSIDEDRVLLVYIPQYHTLANTVTIGLTAQSLGYPKDGWKRWSELQSVSGRRS